MRRLKSYFGGFCRYTKIYRKPLVTIWKVYTKKFPFVAKLKDGRSLDIPNHNFAWIVSFGLDVKYDKKMEILYLNFRDHCLKFLGTEINGEIPEVFGQEDYGNLNYKDETVVDIGANIGDSSIYFAVMGAKKVIAIEPFPASYSLLKSNISLNEMESVIIPLNVAIGQNDGFVKLDSRINTTTGLGISSYDIGELVRITSLNKLVKEFDLRESILKIDCEGCEYEVFNFISAETLAQFKGLIIEYHSGVRELYNNIKTLFDVKIVSKSGKTGLIIALRRP